MEKLDEIIDNKIRDLENIFKDKKEEIREILGYINYIYDKTKSKKLLIDLLGLVVLYKRRKIKNKDILDIFDKLYGLSFNLDDSNLIKKVIKISKKLKSYILVYFLDYMIGLSGRVKDRDRLNNILELFSSEEVIYEINKMRNQYFIYLIGYLIEKSKNKKQMIDYIYMIYRCGIYKINELSKDAYNGNYNNIDECMENY